VIDILGVIFEAGILADFNFFSCYRNTLFSISPYLHVHVALQIIIF